MSKEIFGEGLQSAFDALGIAANKTYQSCVCEAFITPEVWEVSDADFEKLCQMKDEEWHEDWGWWRHGGCIYEGAIESEYIVNGHTMHGYSDKRIESMLEDVGDDPDDIEYTDYCIDEYEAQNYKSVIQWLLETQKISTEYNIAYFSFSLAKDNGLKLSQFMAKYQP
ncbi:MAG: hypothetical protein PHR82_09155 [Endomicrobiaceae bacterium]|jgi:hypothetical protein|nr:hypothetical protein [Endomicrobiaceae bacterium]